MYGTTIDLAGLEGLSYARLSDDPRGTRYGVTRQDEDIAELIVQLGVNVPPERRFKENDLSAWKPHVHRPDFEQSLRLIEKRVVQVVVLYDVDRYLRQPRQLETLIELGIKGKGTILAGVYGGIIDLGTAEGQKDARDRVSRAAYESHRHSERRKRANLQKAKRGEWETGNRPFGYGARMKCVSDECGCDQYHNVGVPGQPLEPEAAAFRRAVIDVLAGKSIRSITRQWNEAGMTTTRGNKWNATQLRDILEKPRYAALKVYDGETYPGTWTGLIDVNTHRALVHFLTNPERSNGRVSWEQKHLGSGLYLCGICETTRMQSCSGGGGKPMAYKCRAIKHLTCNAASCDDWVTGRIMEWFGRSKCHLLLKGKEELDDLIKKKSRLLADLDEITHAKEFTIKMKRDLAGPIKELLEKVERDQTAAVSTTVAGTLIDVSREAREAGKDAMAAVSAHWATMTVTQRASAIDEVATVTIGSAEKRGPGFDPTRVDIKSRENEDYFAAVVV